MIENFHLDSRPVRAPSNRSDGRRSKTGCLTCRRRRIKCDEAKPICRQCERGGRYCELLPSHREHKWVHIKYAAESIPTLIHPALYITEREHQSISYFHEVTLVQLGGVSPVDKGFWSEGLMQASTYIPVIRHSVIALGSLHRDFIDSRDPFRQSESFSREQYGKALRLMKEGLKDSRADVLLICCLLFAVFECLSGNYRDAAIHVRSGMTLLQGKILDSADGVEFVQASGLLAIFQRLWSQVLELDEREDGVEVPRSDLSPFAYGSKVIFHDSSDRFEQLLHQFLQKVVTMPRSRRHTLTPTVEGSTYMEKFAQEMLMWNQKIDACLSSQTDLPSPRVANMKMYRMLLDIIMFKDPSKGETAYDAFMEHFKGIVKTARESLSTSEIHGAANGQPNSGSLFNTEGLSILSPLFVVATRCRDPIIRREAIHLLRTFRIRNGFWDSQLAAMVAEKVMWMEESTVLDRNFSHYGCPSQIFEEARVRYIGTTFGNGKSGKLKLILSSKLAPEFCPAAFEQELHWSDQIQPPL